LGLLDTPSLARLGAGPNTTPAREVRFVLQVGSIVQAREIYGSGEVYGSGESRPNTTPACEVRFMAQVTGPAVTQTHTHTHNWPL